MVDANVAGNRVEPRHSRLAVTISVAHLVNPQPGFLQQVIGIGTAHRFCKKKPVQTRTDVTDQNRGRGKIALLVADHQRLEIFAGVHAMERPT